ncbi:hypothetical protein JL722_10453 [Aureococcus anophagefferens]|nr:hypothetical protein JL722_10453 [Aureococcus anophagefferens]
MARSVVLALLAARASALCVLRDATVCWGNEHQYVERANFFDGIDVQLAPALADLDGDGDLDLVLGEYYGTLFYYENVGSAASPSYEAVTGSANPFDGIDVGSYSKPALADLDGDGDLDLVVGELNLFLYYYENVGNATSPSYEAVTGSANPFDGIDVGWHSAPALADLDGDGDLDLVVGEDGGTLFYYENVGSAASPSYEAVTGAANPFDGIDVGAFGHWSKPAFADVDGDGDLDLVVGEYDGTLFYYENVGSAASPSYEAVTDAANPFDGIDVGYNSAPALADLDGDGDLDLVLGEEDGVLNYYETVGSAASPDYAPVTGAVSPFDGIDVGSRSKPALADLDGDGDLDLVVGEVYGFLYYYENVGSAASPTYAARTGSANPFDGIDVTPSYEAVPGTASPFDGIGVGWSSAPAFADLDGDGDLDLVVGEYWGGLYYYENFGSAASPTYAARTGTANPFDGIDVSGSARARRPRRRRRLDLVVGEDNGALNYYENVGSKGVCDLTSVIFSEASCQCLGGFDHEVPDVVMQCGECQAAGTVETATFDGYFNIANCTSCDAGTFSAEGDPQCTKCAAGKSSAAGASECASCSAGSYSAPGASECIDCEAGTYQDLTGQSSCKLADAGFFVDAIGASEQIACDAGKYSGSGADECIDCEAGTYQDLTGQSSCKLADAGFFVDAIGASEQIACDAGKYSGSGASECSTCTTACDAGKYSGSGADECVDCEAGTYQDATGQSSCALADAGSFVKRTASEQTACDAGKYSGSGASECDDCAAGTYQDATGQSSCALADGGSFVKRTASEQRAMRASTAAPARTNRVRCGQVQRLGAAKCDDCAAGTYQDATGQSSCALADGGSFVQADGASEQTACDAGKYSGSGADECIDCEAGTYQDATGQSSCKLADGGSFVDAMGASEQRECPAGSFSGSASGKCDDCAAGTFQVLTGQSSCALAGQGFYAGNTGASEQTACPAGSFSGSGASECLDCEAGTYQDATGQSSCKLAEAGSFVASTGASASTPCFAGSYAATASSECATCEVGTYSTEGSDTCTLCPSGYSSDAEGASECEACPVGKYKGAGSGPCLDCAAAKYADEEGSSDCKLAEAGSFVASTGASASTPCFAGSYAATASSECATCEVGTYSTEGSDTCTLCPSGYSSDAEGASECEACPVGKYKGAGSGPCLDCAAAKYADEEGSSDCKLAEAGSFVASTGASASTPCFAGSYAATASSECATCEVGTYSTEGSDTCTLCPSGYSSDAEGASECEACPVGKYKGAGSGPCLDCAAAKYADEEASSDCKLAEAGSFVASTGASASTACFAGTYAATASSECATCEVGTYSTEGSDTCTLCPSGYSSDAEGASECEACPVGKYKGAGSGPCLDCAAAKYADEEGSSDCKLAEAGSFVGSTGASASTACFAGTYSATASSACATCEVGTYSTEGDSSCTSCPAGFSSSAAGASECSACPVGTFKGAGSGPCVECGAGTFGPETGQSSCLLANSGFFVNDTGASEQTACPAGSFSGSGASECDECERGTYQDATGQSSCALADGGSFVDLAGAPEQTSCPAGSFSGSGASECVDCEIGTFSGEGESSCTSCPAGYSSSSAGASECSACPVGTFKGAGSGPCIECGVGTYGPETGQSSCALADAGSFVNETGASTQTLCDAGKISGSGATECDACQPGPSADGGTSCQLSNAGSFVGASGAFEATPCPAGSYSGMGASACTRCEEGTFAAESGQSSCALSSGGTMVASTGATAETMCPAGRYSGAAASYCAVCPAGTTNKAGEAACTTVDAGKRAPPAEVVLMTIRSSLALNGVDASAFNDDAVANAQLKAALEATLVADLFSFMVDSAGIASVGPAVANGSSAKIDFELEANYTAAAGEDLMSTEELVLEDFELDLLAKIEDGTLQRNIEEAVSSGARFGPRGGRFRAHYFYDTAANRCVDCGNKIKASGDNIIGTVLAVLFVVAAIGVVMRKFGIFTVLGHGVDAIREVVQGEAVKDIAKAKLEEHYEDDEDGEAAGSDTQSADDKESSGRSMEQNVMTKAKIVIATYQIACSIPWSLPQVRFPTIFKEALKLGSVVNLSFISFAKTECFGDFDYFDKLLFVTLLPVVFVLLIAVGFAIRYACVDRSRRDEILSGASYWILFTLYVLVPSTSAYCLRYFACAKYDGGYGDGVNVMRIDPTISCDSPSYDAWLPYVLFSIVAYPVGVPLGFACLLWRLRRRLDPDVDHQTFQKLEARANDPTLESVRFLYEEFKPSCFMFMVYEVSRRIFLTGCLSMFVPDSISQIAIGLLGSLISYRVFSHYEPYVEEDDGVVSEVAQTELVLVFFYALMVFATDNLEQHDGVFSGKVFASLLVVLLASTLLIALWLIILANFSGDELRSCFAGLRRRAGCKWSDKKCNPPASECKSKK